MLGREKCELDVAVRKGGGCEGENIYDGWLFFGVQFMTSFQIGRSEMKS